MQKFTEDMKKNMHRSAAGSQGLTTAFSLSEMPGKQSHQSFAPRQIPAQTREKSCQT